MEPRRRGYTPPYGTPGEPKASDVPVTVITAMILLGILIVVALL